MFRFVKTLSPYYIRLWWGENLGGRKAGALAQSLEVLGKEAEAWGLEGCKGREFSRRLVCRGCTSSLDPYLKK